MKVVTWNVNGIRSRIFNNKTSSEIGKVKDISVEADSPMQKILELNPDIITLQETRCDTKQGNRFKIPGFKSFFNESKESEHRGPNRYSGTCFYISDKIEIEKIDNTIDNYNDTEGRILILHMKEVIILSVYAPNSGTNYEKRIYFDEAILNFLNSQNKNLIFCGDLNMAKDTHFDKTKVKPGPCFYPHELSQYDKLINMGFRDTIFEDEIIYTWWDPRTKKIDGIASTRKANKGWRLDYFFTKGMNKVSSKVYKNIGETNPLASDHAPVLLTIE
jgi:exodeoxyribonuclease III